jgi:hypothetical protein
MEEFKRRKVKVAGSLCFAVDENDLFLRKEKHANNTEIINIALMEKQFSRCKFKENWRRVQAWKLRNLKIGWWTVMKSNFRCGELELLLRDSTDFPALLIFTSQPINFK